MFEGAIMSGLMEQEKKINFENLEFPIYLKSVNDVEWYRFDSIDKLVTIRGHGWRGKMLSVGIMEGLDRMIFVDLYSNRGASSKKEFNTIYKKTLDELNIISSNNTDSDK